MRAETRIAEAQGSTSVSMKDAVWLAGGFGLLKYVLATLAQITVQHAGYGIFRYRKAGCAETPGLVRLR